MILFIFPAIGNTLGFLVMILGLGAMLGKLVAESGAAQQITNGLIQIFGVQNSPIKVLLIRIILSGLCLGLCIILPFFAKMASFIGALCSSFSSVIFPFYAYYTLSYEKLNTWERSMNLFIAFFGFVMCITGLFGVIESFELQN